MLFFCIFLAHMQFVWRFFNCLKRKSWSHSYKKTGKNLTPLSLLKVYRRRSLTTGLEISWRPNIVVWAPQGRLTILTHSPAELHPASRRVYFLFVDSWNSCYLGKGWPPPGIWVMPRPWCPVWAPNCRAPRVAFFDRDWDQRIAGTWDAKRESEAHHIFLPGAGAAS
jgi:hypothetical protein